MTTKLHQMDKLPPLDHTLPAHAGVSVTVKLVYANGKTCKGWHDLFAGWVRFGDRHATKCVANDNVQPIGWRMS